MRIFLLHIFTGADKETYDVGRVLLVLMCIGYLAESAWHLKHSGSWDPLNWGAGAAALLGGGGAGIGLKAKAEPPAAPRTTPPPRAP